MEKNKFVYSILTIIAILAVGYFIFTDLNAGDEKNESLTIPNLNREFIIPDKYSDEIKENTMEQYNTIVSKLEEDPRLRNEWLQLAILYNAVEDYEGAEEIWLYMTKVWTLDHVSFSNLGNLYTNYLVDFDKAEKYLERTVELRPDQPQLIENLYVFLRFKKENPEKALSLLETGYELFPEELYYPIRIGEHYRDIGDIDNAKKYLEEALALSQEQDLPELEASIREELEKL